MSQANYKAFTARFDPETFEELRAIAELQNSSMNKIVVDAVTRRLRESRRSLVDRFEKTLERLKAYESRDPDYEDAIAAFAEGEIDTAVQDPAEGRVVHSDKSKNGQRIEEILTGG